MKIYIETTGSASQEQEAARIRHEVFEREWKCRIAGPVTSSAKRAMHLLARVYPGGEPIGALSVVETTGDTPLHGTFGISVPDHVTVARYTQLAVLKPYRGMHVAVSLMQEAQVRCAIQYHFDYTWLLFSAARARSSALCTSLGFQASGKVFESEFGPMYALVRKESRCCVTPAKRRYPGDPWRLEWVAA
jgi:hypothetical protein